MGQFGYLNPDGVSIAPIDSFENGSTNSDGVPVDTRVNLDGITIDIGLYATDTIHPWKSLAVTLSDDTITPAFKTSTVSP